MLAAFAAAAPTPSTRRPPPRPRCHDISLSVAMSSARSERRQRPLIILRQRYIRALVFHFAAISYYFLSVFFR
jgi:hypothetical protein